MSVTLNDLAAQQWSAIFNLLKAEMAATKRLNAIAWNCESTGHSGTVTLLDLRKSTQPWTGINPVGGVSIGSITRSDYGTGRQMMTVSFNVLLAVQEITARGSTPPNLDDALARLQALVSDGNGKGVAAILTDPLNYTLGGTCFTSRLDAIQFADDSMLGENPDVNAYAWMTFVTQKLVALS